VITETEIIHIIDDVLQGLDQLFTHDMMHRDIKSENVVRNKTDGIWKLCDYGFVKHFSKTKDKFNNLLMTNLGTPAYMSPYRINEKAYGIKSDIYSVGILLYELLYEGEFPFIGNNLN